MTKKPDSSELRFVIRNDNKKPPVETIPTPKVITDKRSRNIDTIGIGESKFVTIEYIANIVNDEGDPREKAMILLAISTPSRGNAYLPQHISILNYLEELVNSRNHMIQLVQVAGGKIDDLSELIRQAQAYNSQNTPYDQRTYGGNEPYFDSDSIEQKRKSDRPENLDQQQELLERIKLILEEYSDGFS